MCLDCGWKLHTENPPTNQDSNLEPPCYELFVLTAAPPCRPSHVFLRLGKNLTVGSVVKFNLQEMNTSLCNVPESDLWRVHLNRGVHVCRHVLCITPISLSFFSLHSLHLPPSTMSAFISLLPNAYSQRCFRMILIWSADIIAVKCVCVCVCVCECEHVPRSEVCVDPVIAVVTPLNPAPGFSTCRQ